MEKIVLASASPRRRDLLASLGLEFEVCVTDVDESVPVGISPTELVAMLARRKAEAAAEKYIGRIVIAADTVVSTSDGEILGKPRCDEDAARMLKKLSGTHHTVSTGVCVIADTTSVEVVTTDVYMRDISEREIFDYIRTGEPRDKAGAYGIQGLGGVFVTRIDGEYFNVTGMPKEATARLLSAAGVDVLCLCANK